MNDTRVAKGAMVWFLGILVPAAHHAVLFAAATWQGSSNIVRTSESITKALPPIEWLYLLGMTIVGLTLVISGIRNKVTT